jgi:hypothetical protein
MNVLTAQLSKSTGVIVKPALQRFSRSQLPQSNDHFYLPASHERINVARDQR